jgi:hypothetical protein
MSACVTARLKACVTPPMVTVPVKNSVPSVGRLVSRTVSAVSASSPPPAATMKLPTTEAGLPPPSSALAGWPSRMTPEPLTVGAWFSGVTLSVMAAVSERFDGVAPSLICTAKPSCVFWFAPVAVWTYTTRPSITSCCVKIAPMPRRVPLSRRWPCTVSAVRAYTTWLGTWVPNVTSGSIALSVATVRTVLPISLTDWVASATATGSFDGVTVTSSARVALSAGASESVTVTTMRVLAAVVPSSMSAEANTSWFTQAFAAATLPVKL